MPGIDLWIGMFGPMPRAGILDYYRPLSAADKNGFVPLIVSGDVFSSQLL